MPAEAGIGEAVGKGLVLRGLISLAIVPAVAVVDERELVREVRIDRIPRPDRQRDDQVAVEDVDVIEVAELVDLSGIEAPSVIRGLDRGCRSGDGDEQTENENPPRHRSPSPLRDEKLEAVLVHDEQDVAGPDLIECGAARGRRKRLQVH